MREAGCAYDVVRLQSSPVNRRQSLLRLAQAGAWCVFPWARQERGPTAGTPPNSSTPAYYVDVGGPAGLAARTIIQGHESKDFLLATTGGGIAVFDYDHDGWLATKRCVV